MIAEFEISMFCVPGSLDDRHGESEQNADRDRHVHVEAPVADRPQGAAKERLTGESRGRQHDERRKPMEEIAGLRRDVASIAGPDSDREQHDVHGREAGYRKAAQKMARLAGGEVFRLVRRERIGAIADPREIFDHACRLEPAVLPFDGEAVRRVVDAGSRETRQFLQNAFDFADTSGASDPVDDKVDCRYSVVMMADEA